MFQFRVRGVVALLAFAAVVMLAPCARADDTPAKKEAEKLQGSWRLVKQQEDGKELSAAEIKGTILVVNQRSVSFLDKGKLALAMRFSITDVTPDVVRAEFVWLSAGENKGKASLGIWKIEGDTLRTAIGYIGEPRPTEFPSKEGSKWTYSVWKRIKD